MIGVSSGIFGATSPEEKIQAVAVGQFKKAQYSITKGVQFVQIDLESISEFQEPDLDKNMERIKRLGIRYGLHAETPAFGGRELPHLDSAINLDYERGHRRLLVVLDNAGKLEYEYVLMHSSESTPFLLLGRELQPTDIVDIWGRPLEKFIKEVGGDDLTKNWIMDWIWDQDYIWLDVLHDTPRGYIKRAEDTRKFELRQGTRRDLALQRERASAEDKKVLENGELVEKAVKEREEIMWRVESVEFFEKEKKELLEYFVRLIKSKSLSYGPERTAYYITAKWMEFADDPLWNNIIEASIKYFSKVDGKTEEEWLKDKGIEKSTDGKWSIDNEKFREEYRLWVPAVSAKYIWGHFNQDQCPDKSWNKYEDPKNIIEKYNYNIPFLLETPMAGTGIEEFLRFPNPVQMYCLVKEVGSKYMGLAIDIEHMLMCNLDPEVSFDILPEDAGKYVRVIHCGWPSALGPAHIPIPLGSEQQMYLYKMYFKLRQKGFGKDSNTDYFLIFERGGGADPVQQSILALRVIVDFLNKDIKPEELITHPEFFGVELGQVAAYQRQWEIIENHGRDPLKGLIVVPEEQHTFLGRTAIEKGKRPEEWEKEEHR
jgi:hypothetical protein